MEASAEAEQDRSKSNAAPVVTDALREALQSSSFSPAAKTMAELVALDMRVRGGSSQDIPRVCDLLEQLAVDSASNSSLLLQLVIAATLVGERTKEARLVHRLREIGVSIEQRTPDHPLYLTIISYLRWKAPTVFDAPWCPADIEQYEYHGHFEEHPGLAGIEEALSDLGGSGESIPFQPDTLLGASLYLPEHEYKEASDKTVLLIVGIVVCVLLAVCGGIALLGALV